MAGTGKKQNPEPRGGLVQDWAIVKQSWDVDRLCEDLALIKGRETKAGQGPSPLSPTEMVLLNGTLVGASTRVLAQMMGRKESGIKTDLSKTIYHYLKLLLKYGEGARYPKEQVLELLRDRGYGRQPQALIPERSPQALERLAQVVPSGPLHFVGRQGELKQVMAWLSGVQAGSSLAVEGVGGIGNTALVRRALERFLATGTSAFVGRSLDTMRFVYVMAGQQYLTATGTIKILGKPLGFQQVLGEIAQQIDFQLPDGNFSQTINKKFGEKLGGEFGREAISTTGVNPDGEGLGTGLEGEWIQAVMGPLNRSLGERPTLVLIDNGEQLPRELLEQWLARVPGAVKVIVTSRTRLAVDQRIHLAPLEEGEIGQLIHRGLQHHSVSEAIARPADQKSLARVSQGIPLVAVQGLGRAALGLPMGTVLADLRDPTAGLMRFCVAPVVDPLWRSPTVQRLLLAFARFPVGAIASVVYQVSGLGDREADRAFGELMRHSLLQQVDWRLWPLAQAYVKFLTDQMTEHLTNHLTDQSSNGSSEELENGTDSEMSRQVEALDRRWLAWGQGWLARHGDRDRWEWTESESLERQWENLEGLLDWCVAGDHPEGFWSLWGWIKGYTQTAGLVELRKRWLAWVSQAFQGRGAWEKAATAYFDLGLTYSNADAPGSLAIASRHFEQAWQWRSSCGLQLRADLVVNQCRVAIRQGEEMTAQHWLRQGRSLLKETATPQPNSEPVAESIAEPVAEPVASIRTRLEIQLFYCEGELHFEAGRWEQSRQCYEQAKGLAIASNWQRAAVLSEGWLGDIAFRQGRWDEAEKQLESTIQRAEVEGDLRCLALCRYTLAEVAQAQGRDRRAHSLAAKALRGFRGLGMTQEESQTVQFLKSLSFRPVHLGLLLDGEL